MAPAETSGTTVLVAGLSRQCHCHTSNSTAMYLLMYLHNIIMNNPDDHAASSEEREEEEGCEEDGEL